MKRYYLLILVLASLQLSAQEQKSETRLADEAYAREEFAVAGSLYQRTIEHKGKRAPLEYFLKLAHSFTETGNYRQAAGWYEQIILRPDCPAATYFAYGEVLRNMEAYDSARVQYQRFHTSNADSLVLKEAALKGCELATQWQQRTPRLSKLEGMKELNTSYSEWISGVVNQGLLLVGNGYRKLRLNDGSESNPATDKRTYQPYYKAYVYQQYSQGNSTMYLESMLPKVLKKYDYHIGPACFNNAEDTLYVTVNEQVMPKVAKKKGVIGVRRLALYRAVKQNDNWSPLEILPVLNMDGFSSSHPVLNHDGDVLYFVSDRPGGIGQTDIWYSEKQPDGSWGKPVNCGARLNTVAAETFPTFNEEGAMYFSSKGHPGMGGYDIYRAKGSKAEWETPLNMRAPFNSGADDMGLVLKRNGYEGFFSSNRVGGMGSDDVYHFLDPVYFSRLDNMINPKADNTTETNTNTTATTTTTPNIKRELTPEELEQKHAVEKLRFLYDFNSVVLLAESRKTLDYVLGIMKQHPDWKLMVLSFTDSRGQDEYNLDLSALRCYAVIDYLVERGISSKRLYYKNMGEGYPVNPCKDGVPCTESQQRENRRSELRIIY
ncbi:OmpA family protein [Chitinophaga sp. SYP-B3965]|uniref:OmpA family protein n=1 Tax=Chitinophaga sp. SYP-B3965 TaxID=2663120 RepID=UPI001299DE40|nr:OmpA family protein [Chitinophaga sp. SYP-B3965]MRG43733.1 OmpA family protein [Chitinophaga sp. SYP-B3965]